MIDKFVMKYEYQKMKNSISEICRNLDSIMTKLNTFFNGEYIYRCTDNSIYLLASQFPGYRRLRHSFLTSYFCEHFNNPNFMLLSREALSIDRPLNSRSLQFFQV